MKLMKKLIVLALSLLMILSVVGCSGLKVVKEIATVDGNLISKAEYMYYLENIKAQMLTEAGISTKEEAKIFWEGEIDGQKASDVAKNKAMEECIRTEIGVLLAKEAGNELSAETKSSIKSYVDAGGEQIDEIKDMTGLSDDMLKTLLEKSEYASMFAQNYYTENTEALTPSEEDVDERYFDEYVRVKHVLISSSPSQEQIEAGMSVEDYRVNQKETADEVLEKAKNGEDFDALVKEYGEDPGMETSPDGYTITNNGQMVAEFEQAALALEVGEVSELVETSYGWHVLKRYELLTDGAEYESSISTITNELTTDLFNEYIDSLKGNYTIEIEQSVLDGIKVK